METVRLLYPDWLVVAAIAFIIILVFVGIIFFCASIKYIHYISALENSVDTTYFIKDLDGDNLINVEEIEQISQGYNRETNQYEIVYYLKSLHTVKETFNDGLECRERFGDILRILNDYNC